MNRRSHHFKQYGDRGHGIGVSIEAGTVSVAPAGGTVRHRHQCPVRGIPQIHSHARGHTGPDGKP